MTRTDQLITFYDSATNMGITCPAAYAAEAQDFFRQHDLFLGEPREESTGPVDEFAANNVVRLPMVASSDDAEQELQKLHNLTTKFREYIRRDADQDEINE